MRLYRALLVLPTLFTLTSVFLGLLSILSAAEGNYRLGALAILFAVLFDVIDGRVARVTRTQSKFGIQIDSLADVVSFGVAPAVLVYMALLKGHYMVGAFDLSLPAVFLYLACGAMRLARYNVDAQRRSRPVRYFTGLPIPAGAGLLAGLVFGLMKEEISLSGLVVVLILVLLAFLMVSTVKYRKKVFLGSADTRVLIGLLMATSLMVGIFRPSFLFFSLFAFYLAVGPVEGTVHALLSAAARSRGQRRLPVDDHGDSNLVG